jgi:hypothetical protein
MATRNRYAEIMAQYAQSQPFSFFGYPESYSGGYDVAQPQAYAAPVNQYADIMAQGVMSGGGGRPVDFNPEWTALSDAERAAYYRENPIEGKLALLGQDILSGASLMGQIAKNANADNYYNNRLIKQGYDPSAFAFGPPNLTGGFVAKTPQQAAAESASAAQVAQAQAQAEAAQQPITETIRSDQSLSGGNTGGGGGRYSGDNSGLNAGWGSRDAGGLAQGGYVSMQHLGGPDPMGPDDGYGALKDGEYVINDKAVKKYGIELMNAINSGKISKGKLRGLLEM